MKNNCYSSDTTLSWRLSFQMREKDREREREREQTNKLVVMLRKKEREVIKRIHHSQTSNLIHIRISRQTRRLEDSGERR